MASDKVIELTEDTFDEQIQGDTPVLVDFWAAWCGPCRVVAPVLDEIADEMDGQVRIAKVDIDANQELAHKYQVSSIPTFLLFHKGELKDRMMGARPKSAFQQFIQGHTAAATA